MTSKARNLADLLADGFVGTSEIADSAITDAKLNDGAVVEAKIANNAVTTDKINNSAVTMAKLSASGTPGSGNFLRGDGSWQTISTTPTTAQVLSAYAGAAYGAVGTYHAGYQSDISNFLNSSTYYGANTNVAGSVLTNIANNTNAVQRTNLDGASGTNAIVSAGFSGTWRRLTSARSNSAGANNFTASFLFLRIA